MANTTNYNWETPDDTDLVKDGASAIRSLGTAIDTTVFNNASAAIAKTLIDAKGDLIVGSAADTVARLAVGTNDYVLTADSAATNGVKWAAVAAGTRGLQEIIPTSVSVGSGTATVGTNGKISLSTVGTNLSVNGCFTSTYTNYKIVFDLTTATTYSTIKVRLRASGTDNTGATSYKSAGGDSSQPAAASGFGGQVFSDDYFRFGWVGVDGTTGGEFSMYRPYLTERTVFTGLNFGNAAGDRYFSMMGGQHDQSTSYDGFSIVLAATATLSGSIYIYGWSE